MSDRRLTIGRRGEDSACRMIESQGYRILERNYKTRFAEIDIIAEHEGAVVFMEVKARTSNRYGSPRDAVGAGKQKKIMAGALQYIREKNLGNRPIRFDVITVYNTFGEIHMEHIPHAFHG